MPGLGLCALRVSSHLISVVGVRLEASLLKWFINAWLLAGGLQQNANEVGGKSELRKPPGRQ